MLSDTEKEERVKRETDVIFQAAAVSLVSAPGRLSAAPGRLSAAYTAQPLQEGNGRGLVYSDCPFLTVVFTDPSKEQKKMPGADASTLEDS